MSMCRICRSCRMLFGDCLERVDGVNGGRVARHERRDRGVDHAMALEHRTPAKGIGLDDQAVVPGAGRRDLDDGVRLMTNIVDVEPDAVAIGQPVEVTWEPLTDGRNLPQFRPTDA